MIGIVLGVWVIIAIYAWLRHGDLWREAIFRHPVLVLESDDWGPGSAEDGDRLRQLVACAGSHHDSHERPATVTLGVVLAVADTPIGIEDEQPYRRQTLAEERFADIREAMREGVRRGVFSLQLHGAEHYWPPALLAAGARDESVMRWLATRGVPRAEALPSHLQSRWTDASTLPSKPLSDAEIAAAADDEVALFEKVFEAIPVVVVPPTFVWDERVERIWVKHGIRAVITPGCRYEGRDALGKLRPPARIIRNGDRTTDAGAVYLVRDVYFEPTLGHRAEPTVDRIVYRARLGRAALVEMHRFNFVGDSERARASLAELDRLLGLTLQALPDLQFLPPDVLADAIVRQDPDLVETRLTGRLAVWLRRLWEQRRVRWVAVATLAIVPAGLLWFAAALASSRLNLGGRL